MKTNLWIAKEDAIIQHFMRTPIYTRLLQTPELIAIFVGGSYHYGTTYEDEHSDYDIIVMVNQNQYITPTQFMHIDGKVLHWTTLSPGTYTGSSHLAKQPHRVWAVHAGMVKFNRFGRHLFLYENPKYSSVINRMLTLQNEFQKMHFYQYVRELDNMLCIKPHYNHLRELYHYPKCFYHIFAAFKDLTGKGSTDWIKWVKTLELTNENDILRVLHDFKNIVFWCDQHPVDIEKLRRALHEFFFDKNNQLIL